MGADMLIRDLYLPAGTTLDLATAEATAGELCRHATLDDPASCSTKSGSATPGSPTSTTGPSRPCSAAPTRCARPPSTTCTGCSTRSPHRRDVARFRFDNDGGSGVGVDAYVPGAECSSTGTRGFQHR